MVFTLIFIVSQQTSIINLETLIDMEHGQFNPRNKKLLLLLLLTAIWLSAGGSGYFTCTEIWKERRKVTGKFNSGGLHERHVVATGNWGTV